MNDLPLVTIGLPVFNGQSHLRETLASLLNQDYQNFEIVISDNNSTDATEQIAREFVAKYPNIKYHRNDKNIGAAKNFTRVAELATGKYFMWSSDHDYHSSSMISGAVSVMEHDPSVVLASGKVQFVSSEGTPVIYHAPCVETRGFNRRSWRLLYVLWSLLSCYPIYGVIRTETLKQQLPLPRAFACDRILLTKLACSGHFAHLPAETIYMRRSQGDIIDQAERIGLSVDRWSWLAWPAGLIMAHVQIVFDNFGKSGASITDDLRSSPQPFNQMFLDLKRMQAVIQAQKRALADRCLRRQLRFAQSTIQSR